MKLSAVISRLLLLCTFGLCVSIANATIVHFHTVEGEFLVNLYDEETPETVANFLHYVDSGAYKDTFIHRSIPGFVIQGGGYYYDHEGEEPTKIPAGDSVQNEPKFSSRRGTIAMAKLGSNPNSATVEWFINLSDNHNNLDVQNGGFTVFGEVVDDGMEVVDALAKVKTWRLEVPFSDLPLRNFNMSDAEDGVDITDEHLLMVHNITVVDASPDSAADLNPVPNTLLGEKADEDNRSGSSGSSSASWWLLAMLMLAGLGLRKRS